MRPSMTSSASEAAVLDREDAKTPTGDDDLDDPPPVEEPPKKSTRVPLNKVDATFKTCSNLFENHPCIKKKFSDLLQNSFR